MRAKVRQILEECIEIGIERGYEKAYKHTDNPSEMHLGSCIELGIWYEIDQRFDFEQCASRNLCDEVVKGFDQLESKRNKCNDHPDAPHGMDRSASHNAGRYVCECESWEPEEMLELREALEEAVYLLNPTDEDTQEKAGVYRVVTALEKLNERNT
jgi:hypothetical protein